MPCYAMLCHALPWHTLLCSAMLCHVIRQSTTLDSGFWPCSYNRTPMVSVALRSVEVQTCFFSGPARGARSLGLGDCTLVEKVWGKARAIANQAPIACLKRGCLPLAFLSLHAPVCSPGPGIRDVAVAALYAVVVVADAAPGPGKALQAGLLPLPSFYHCCFSSSDDFGRQRVR